MSSPVSTRKNALPFLSAHIKNASATPKQREAAVSLVTGIQKDIVKLTGECSPRSDGTMGYVAMFPSRPHPGDTCRVHSEGLSLKKPAGATPSEKAPLKGVAEYHDGWDTSGRGPRSSTERKYFVSDDGVQTFQRLEQDKPAFTVEINQAQDTLTILEDPGPGEDLANSQMLYNMRR